MDGTTILTYFEQYPETLWAIAALVFFILEVSVASGIGFFFAALGALTLSIGLSAEMMTSYVDTIWYQLSWFFVFTAVWAAILWIPLRKLHSRKHVEGWENFVGTHAEVSSEGLVEGKTGNVKWSGTTMRAKIAEGSTYKSFAGGTEVTVVGNKGSTLFVDIEK